jgi:8-amino-7-oxononanoate synthase
MEQPPAVTAWLARLQAQARQRAAAHLQRTLNAIPGPAEPEIIFRGQRVVQFSGNNYLGLANHPAVVEAAHRAIERFGFGTGASRLLAGSAEVHHELETALAAFKQTEAALVFPTGYMANLALFAFAGRGDLVVADRLNHASLLDGAALSGARQRRFPHRDYARAEVLLADHAEESSAGGGAQRASEAPPRQKFIVTDSVFSMDGDIADLAAVCDLAQRHGALPLVDEAHATGVIGPGGRGVAALQGVEHRLALTTGTMSKALGSIGGFIAGPRVAIDALINMARPFIFTTAAPAAASAAALAALRLVEQDPRPRQRVLALADHVRAEAQAMGYSCGNSCTPIIPLVLTHAHAAVEASSFLLERGLYVPAIRPPAVPPATARLRISLMATHSDQQVQQLLDALKAWRRKQAHPK